MSRIANYETVLTPQGESFLVREFKLPYFRSGWHFHRELELTLILDSQGQRFVGDSIESYQAGDLVLVGSNLPHCWHNDMPLDRPIGSQAHSLVVHFDQKFAGERFFDMPELQPINDLLKRADRGIQFSAETVAIIRPKMLALLKSEGSQRLLRLFSILSYLATKGEGRDLSSPNFVPKLNDNSASNINTCYQYVLAHIADTIRVEDVSKLLNMTDSAFCRYFKRNTGRTFISFVNEIRMGNASKLLIESSKSIKEIAEESGFGNISNFNRRFREAYRLTPGMYRKQHRRY